MNEVRKTTRISDSKPASVLDRISAAQGLVVEHADCDQNKRQTRFIEATLTQPFTVDPGSSAVAESCSVAVAPVAPESSSEFSDAFEHDTEQLSEEKSNDQPEIILRISPDTQPDFERQDSVEGFWDSCIESAEQVQQLAQRLGETENDLKAREADLEKRIESWNQRMQWLETDFEFKLSQLQQQASQVRCQQLNLMQLQTDIVKSHEATKKAIETLVAQSGGDAKTIETLKALKYQLSGRFEYIARRWEHLAGLLQSQQDEKTAQCKIDDSVDWAGELS